MTDRRHAAAVVMSVGAAVTIVGSVLTWVRSGSAARNSYDIFRLVGRLGFAPDGPAATALRWWPVMPLLAVLGVVAAWSPWGRAAGIVGALAATYAGAVALAVINAPAGGLVEIGPGPAVSTGGAAILLAGSIGAVTPVRARPTGLDAREPHGAQPGDPS